MKTTRNEYYERERQRAINDKASELLIANRNRKFWKVTCVFMAIFIIWDNLL